jgi:hypothetical protein
MKMHKELSNIHTTCVHVNATNVVKVAENVYRIEFPAREISDAEREVLRNLFPNLTDRAYQLLDQEAMLNIVCEPPAKPESSLTAHADCKR